MIYEVVVMTVSYFYFIPYLVIFARKKKIRHDTSHQTNITTLHQ